MAEIALLLAWSYKMLKPSPGQNRWLTRNHIVNLLRANPELPVLPDIIRNLEVLLMDPETNAAQVVAVLNAEPVIVGRILTLANSALYSSGRNTLTDIQLAVQRLGYNAIRNLVYSAKLPDLFNELPPDLHIHFWQHGQTVALLSKSLLLQRGAKIAESADLGYLAGLMHDIGILVYLVVKPVEYAELASRALNEEIPLEELERSTFGIDHAELGAMYISKYWELPKEVADAVRGHHDSPDRDDTFSSLANCLFAANLVCNLYNHGNGFSSTGKRRNLQRLQTLSLLGYDVTKIEELLDMAKASVGAIKGMLTN